MVANVSIKCKSESDKVKDLLVTHLQKTPACKHPRLDYATPHPPSLM